MKILDYTRAPVSSLRAMGGMEVQRQARMGSPPDLDLWLSWDLHGEVPK